MRKKSRIYLNDPSKIPDIRSFEIISKKIGCFFHKHLICLLILLLSGLSGLQAQNLFVRINNGTQLSFVINDIQSITFPQSEVSITKADGNTSTFSFSEIQYLSFNDFSTNAAINYKRNQDGLQLYPNPVTNCLYATFNLDKNEIIQLSLIDLQGKELQHKSISCRKGKNIAEIPVTGLQHGMYLFRLQKRENTKIIKFFKN